MIALPAISAAKIASAVFSRTGLKVLIVACVALGIYLLVQDRNGWKAKATLRQAQLVAEQQAHRTTVANYRAAAERARRLDAENVARVKAEQAAINERSSNEYQARIAAARTDAERLRRKISGAAGNSGGGGTAPVPGVPAPAARAPQAAGQDGFSVADRLIATEQAIQLDELIKWVRRQAAIDVNGDRTASNQKP